MDYTKIKTNRQFKDSTAYSKEKFKQLLVDYEQMYFENKGQSYEEYVEENVTEPPKIKTLGQALFFVLFQLKNDLVFGALGAVFGMCGASAHNNFTQFLNLLEQTLEKKSDAKAKI